MSQSVVIDRSPGVICRSHVVTSAVCVAMTLLTGPVRAADKLEKEPRIDFSRTIRPLLANKCLKCHGPGASEHDTDLRLDLAKNAVGTAIVPGRPDQSELMKRVTSRDPLKRMPPPESKLELTDQEVQLLKAWISEGADYTVHWSFVPPVRPTVPKVKRDGWILNTIDRFVLGSIEKAGLEPSPPAERKTLIRRLTLDLTGLPPTPAEIDRFVADQSPRAYERVVDRLLSSQHYGERMAQTWLDLARFGDTNGYENDSNRSMWLYRDWVINAKSARAGSAPISSQAVRVREVDRSFGSRSVNRNVRSDASVLFSANHSAGAVIWTPASAHSQTFSS